MGNILAFPMDRIPCPKGALTSHPKFGPVQILDTRGNARRVMLLNSMVEIDDPANTRYRTRIQAAERVVRLQELDYPKIKPPKPRGVLIPLKSRR